MRITPSTKVAREKRRHTYCVIKWSPAGNSHRRGNEHHMVLYSTGNGSAGSTSAFELAFRTCSRMMPLVLLCTPSAPITIEPSYSEPSSQVTTTPSPVSSIADSLLLTWNLAWSCWLRPSKRTCKSSARWNAHWNVPKLVKESVSEIVDRPPSLSGNYAPTYSFLTRSPCQSPLNLVPSVV